MKVPDRRRKHAAFLMLGLTGCSSAPAPPRAPRCPPTPLAPPAPPPAPALAPAPAAEPGKALELPDAEPAWALSKADVVLQVEQEPTFGGIAIGSPLEPFGHAPSFTLYRDGTAIVEGSGGQSKGFFVYKFSANEVKYNLEHLRDLGFAQLRSHEAHCIDTPQGRDCLSDSNVIALRAKTAGGALREIRNYAGWAPRHQAQLFAIYDRIKVLSAEATERRGARPYLPPKATLFLSRTYPLADLEPRLRDGARPWPLPADLLDRASPAPPWFFVEIDAAQARRLYAAAGTTAIENDWFYVDDRAVQASVVPWLPGVDHAAAIERSRREKK